ncbi:DUF1330 domain-containing protein [Litoreibacter sp.]|nr:DUF1330 domain-containing protein [Litoreibacter sp.]
MLSAIRATHVSGTEELETQTGETQMTAYAILTLKITDPGKMAAYREVAGAALAKYGAKPVQVSPDSVWLDGEEEAPDVAVLLSFPDKEAAHSWRNDPEFADVHALRNGSGDCKILLL